MYLVPLRFRFCRIVELLLLFMLMQSVLLQRFSFTASTTFHEHLFTTSLWSRTVKTLCAADTAMLVYHVVSSQD